MRPETCPRRQRARCRIPAGRPDRLVRLDDLHTLAGHGLLPVRAAGLREELAEHLELVVAALEHLPDQILLQRGIVLRHIKQRQDVAGGDRAEQVGQEPRFRNFVEKPA